ncbi:hypothetical protein ACFYVL_29855 [Streptomyces sp. NPDC004111]|uniref:hypothetical protein n=1 Tax=Streptomyces sp. NPDC004111 TaxID=3364690 RepID=UPI003681B0F2
MTDRRQDGPEEQPPGIPRDLPDQQYSPANDGERDAEGPGLEDASPDDTSVEEPAD